MGFEHVAVEHLAGGEAHEEHVVVLKVGDRIGQPLLQGGVSARMRSAEAADLVNPLTCDELAGPHEGVQSKRGSVLRICDSERNGSDGACEKHEIECKAQVCSCNERVEGVVLVTGAREEKQVGRCWRTASGGGCTIST